MCTLVFGIDVSGPRTVLIATNRDEDPARASEPPQVLSRAPLVVGGRDAVAGGTWLAVRAGGPESAAGAADADPSGAAASGRVAPVTTAGVAMLLNRRDPTPGKPGRRSRGLLTLDVATAAEPRERALAEAAIGHYAPCSLVWLSPAGSWHLSIRAGHAPTLVPIAPGWHAITHFEMDDAADPRATWALQRLAGTRSLPRADAERRLAAILGSHGGGAGSRRGPGCGRARRRRPGSGVLEGTSGGARRSDGRRIGSEGMQVSTLPSVMSSSRACPTESMRPHSLVRLPPCDGSAFRE